jgi:hypothetical protein
VTGNAEAFDEAERGEQLRLFEENLREDLFVKQIQVPGAEPNEIDQKDREDDDEQKQESPDPFQYSSKHGLSVAFPTP